MIYLKNQILVLYNWWLLINFYVNPEFESEIFHVLFIFTGFLESLDDFYMMNSNLVLLQTTNNVFNHSLYNLVTPSSLFAWQRVRAANAMSKTGEQWYQTFKRYNSGECWSFSLNIWRDMVQWQKQICYIKFLVFISVFSRMYTGYLALFEQVIIMKIYSHLFMN